MLLGEAVAPAGGAVAIEALVALQLLALLLVAIGLIKLAIAFVDVIVWMIRKTVGHIPGVGGAIERLATRSAQKLTNTLGRAEAGVDRAVGWTWHNMAHLIRWTVDTIAQLSYGLLVNALAMQLHISRKQAALLIRSFLHPIRLLQTIEHKLLHALQGKTTINTHATGAAVLPRLGAVEGELGHVISWDIPRLRARERAVERRLAHQFDWIRAHPKAVVSLAFAGAVTWALGRLGAGWIRCRNWKRIGKHVCGLPTEFIDLLLGAAVDALLLRNLCALVGAVREIAETFEPALLALVNEIEGFVCGGRDSAPSAIVDSDWQPVTRLPSAF